MTQEPKCERPEFYDYDEDAMGCWNCDGDGYVYGCSWDWQCDTYDEGEGACLCSRRCEVCNPPQLTDAEKAERGQLRALLGSMLTPQPKGQHHD